MNDPFTMQPRRPFTDPLAHYSALFTSGLLSHDLPSPKLPFWKQRKTSLPTSTLSVGTAFSIVPSPIEPEDYFYFTINPTHRDSGLDVPGDAKPDAVLDEGLNFHRSFLSLDLADSQSMRSARRRSDVSSIFFAPPPSPRIEAPMLAIAEPETSLLSSQPRSPMPSPRLVPIPPSPAPSHTPLPSPRLVTQALPSPVPSYSPAPSRLGVRALSPLPSPLLSATPAQSPAPSPRLLSPLQSPLPSARRSSREPLRPLPSPKPAPSSILPELPMVRYGSAPSTPIPAPKRPNARALTPLVTSFGSPLASPAFHRSPYVTAPEPSPSLLPYINSPVPSPGLSPYVASHRPIAPEPTSPLPSLFSPAFSAPSVYSQSTGAASFYPRRTSHVSFASNVTSVRTPSKRLANRTEALAALEGRIRDRARTREKAKERRISKHSDFMSLSDDEDEDEDEADIMEEKEGDEKRQDPREDQKRPVPMEDEDRVLPVSPLPPAHSPLPHHSQGGPQVQAQVQPEPAHTPPPPRPPKGRRRRSTMESWFPLSNFLDFRDDELAGWRGVVEIASAL